MEENNKKNNGLDYTTIKEEFSKSGIPFPLSDEECIGLTTEEKNEINPCGTYCGQCDDYGVVCDGCRNRNGRPIWYDLYMKKDPCEHYVCAGEHELHNCSKCQQYPCSMYFQFPDPNMSEDVKQMWFKLRSENFMKVNPSLKMKIDDTFKKNLERYNK